MLELRQMEIVDFIKNKGMASIHQLGKEFHISLPTIRRDLAKLEKQGTIKRVHGGAMAKGDVFSDTSLRQRVQKNIKEKEKIAAYVVSKLIQPGDTIILDAGTTTYLIASLIRKQKLSGLTIITNSIANATELALCPGITHLLTAGKIHSETMSLLGPETIKSLDGFHVDKAFIGTAGIHWENGLTDINVEGCTVKREFLKRADKKIILADHSKIGKIYFANICSLDEVDMVVTDSGIGNELKNKMDKIKTNFIYI